MQQAARAAFPVQVRGTQTGPADLECDMFVLQLRAGDQRLQSHDQKNLPCLRRRRLQLPVRTSSNAQSEQIQKRQITAVNKATAVDLPTAGQGVETLLPSMTRSTASLISSTKAILAPLELLDAPNLKDGVFVVF